MEKFAAPSFSRSNTHACLAFNSVHATNNQSSTCVDTNMTPHRNAPIRQNFSPGYLKLDPVRSWTPPDWCWAMITIARALVKGSATGVGQEVSEETVQGAWKWKGM
eukprot:1143450-Pelagomonas_calceolata.AAC.6